MVWISETRHEMLSREMMRGIAGGSVPPVQFGPYDALMAPVAAMGEAIKIALTAGAGLTAGLILKYSDPIGHFLGSIPETAEGILTTAYRDVSGGVSTMWGWVTN